jgi:hypothetical protein
MRFLTLTMFSDFLQVLNSHGSSTPKINIFLSVNYFLQFIHYRNRDLILEIIITRDYLWKFFYDLILTI